MLGLWCTVLMVPSRPMLVLDWTDVETWMHSYWLVYLQLAFDFIFVLLISAIITAIPASPSV